MTLSDCRRVLSQYAPVDQFDSAINQVVERIYSSGVWPGLKVEVDLGDYVEDYILTLPNTYDCLMAATWKRSPIPIVDMNVEYSQTGTGYQVAGEGGGGIIDQGLVEVGDEGDFVQLLHRYKITFSYEDGDEFKGLVRRRFQYIEDEHDLIYPAHFGALKQGLLAVRFEDEGDLERAQGYWDRCFSHLSDNAAQTRVGTRQIPGIHFNIGAGTASPFY